MTAITWLVPGIALSLTVAFVASARVGRALGVPRASAMLLIASVGWIVAATLTPISSIDRRLSAACDFSRLGPPSPSDLASVNDTSLNVLLFVPLGIAVALAVRRPSSLLLVVAAVAAPVLIEALQLWLPALRRGCQSADVVDNLLGLAVGLCIGVAMTLAGWAWSLRRSP